VLIVAFSERDVFQEMEVDVVVSLVKAVEMVSIPLLDSAFWRFLRTGMLNGVS
jgi:hypothetical protein